MKENNNIDHRDFNIKTNKKKKVKEKSLKQIDINFFSNFTADLLNSHMKSEFKEKGYNIKSNFFSYGSIEESILGNYNFSKNTNQIFFFHYRTEDYFLDLASDLLDNKKKTLLNMADQIINQLENLIKKIRSKNSSNIFISNFSSISLNFYEALENTLSFTQAELINYMNNKIKKIVSKYSSVYIYDYFSFVNNVGAINLYDEKMWLMARFPFKSRYNSLLVNSYARSILSSIKVPKKCLVLDLDNTLWGGVLGESDKSSVKLGEQFPGNIYKNFQKVVLNLRKIGVFLTVVSKNNEKDVYDFFNNNEECLLKTKDFALIKSNWKDKASNILEISKELNIGLDSIVFFDDSPLEREWVKTQLPEVNVIEVPDNPIYYKDALINSSFFDKTKLTNEDKKRPQLYENEKKRKKHLKSFSNYDDFLKSLKMKIYLKKAASKDVSRVNQLVNKVNQFNLTVKRSNEDFILSKIKSKDCIYTISLEDKFGDFGTVGVIILQFIDDGIWEVDNYLLSCRALGRKVEFVSLYYLLKVLKRKNNKRLFGTFVLGDKNEQAKKFYNNMGFSFNKKTNKWIWDFNKQEIKPTRIAEVKYIER